MCKKVIAAMSGGVDSSVCAAVLKEKGYDIYGITLKLFQNDESEKRCGSDCDIEDAKKVCEGLSIAHFVLDFKSDFKDKVIEDFVSSYENGYTPNPCINCNRYVKFKSLLENTTDFVATGHYAKVEYDESSNRWLLKKAEDIKKDQTYMLYNLKQEELSRVMFPLGSLTKDEVREIAKEYNFTNANKPDSQDICFIPQGDYGKFIENFRGVTFKEGDYVDKNGNILGKHKGYMNYTIGQRKGLGMGFGKPMYVIKKDKDKNLVILGNEEDLYTDTLYATDINLISVDKIEGEMRVTAKTRYSQKESDATVTQISPDRIKVVFDTPVRAITSGQAVVLYDGDVVVGGGKIE